MNYPVKTSILSTHPDDITRAADILCAGGLVAFPTETVYGLGADAQNDAAVGAIFTAKNRPANNPLIVHVKDIGDACAFAQFDKVAMALASAFWPGALSLVLPVRESGLSGLVTAGLDTVAIRVPSDKTAQTVLAAFAAVRGGSVGIAAPSANPSGRISPTIAAHVIAGLDGRIDAVIDGGGCAVGLESTILYPRADGSVEVLRAGGISAEAIAEIIGVMPIMGGSSVSPILSPILSPGQLAVHYAPKTALAMGVLSPRADQLYLTFGGGESGESGDLNLSPSGDLTEAAHNLFDYLHRLDSQALALGKTIAVAPIPNHGLGVGINDRLRRASASD